MGNTFDRKSLILNSAEWTNNLTQAISSSALTLISHMPLSIKRGILIIMKKKDIHADQPATQHDLELLGGNLAFQIEESRQENNERFDKVDDRFKSMENEVGELRQSIDRNSDALAMLTHEIHELRNLEFTVYNHEKRIAKLEEAL